MTAYYTASQLIAGDPEGLRAAGRQLEVAADGTSDLVKRLRDTIAGTEGGWVGPASDLFRSVAFERVALAQSLLPDLDRASVAHQTLAADLEQALDAVRRTMSRSEDLGLAPGDLTGRPLAVARFLLVHPIAAPEIAFLLGQIVAARHAADVARNVFVAAIGGAIAAAAARRDARGSDERGGRRIRSDEWGRREPGGSRESGGIYDLDNDWAGRAILERYLRGGDDWTISDDRHWSEYMMGNPVLRDQLRGPVETHASQAVTDYLAGGGPGGDFSDRLAVAMQNGEGITGYEYLHGTNNDVGGFALSGGTTVTPRPDGTYEVQVKGEYTWNDVIDPNPEYDSDTAKSRIAEVLTLGRADPYDIHITWHSTTTVIVDAAGNVISAAGYPE